MGIPDSHGIIPKVKQFRLLNTPFQNQSTINSINIQIHLFKISLVVVWPYFMPDQQGYALLRSFPELDVAGVLPCSNLERLKGDWFCWMGHPQKDNDQSNLWPFHDDSPLEFWNLFPNFISDKGTLIYIYIYVYVYVYMSMYNIYIYTWYPGSTSLWASLPISLRAVWRQTMTEDCVFSWRMMLPQALEFRLTDDFRP